MNDILAQYDYALLPPELVLDPDHPENDEYIKSTKNIQRLVIAQSAQMRPKTVQMVRLSHTGMSQQEIAQRLNVSPQTVSKHLRKEHGQRLRALLSYYDAAIEGPHKAQRKAMLWRIARSNENEDPRVAIQALAELGKADEAAAALPSIGGTTQIIINTAQLPRGALDGEFTEVTE